MLIARSLLYIITGWTFALVQFPPRPPQPPAPGKAGAPVDFTGYWVSVVFEDWRWRMVTPLKGDFSGVPANAEGRELGESWDPAKDEAAGLQFKAYGAPATMRMPGRVHITWLDDDTLKLETDWGTQTRLFHFRGDPPKDMEPTWQGYSVANWERPPRGANVVDFFLLTRRATGLKGVRWK